MTTLAESRCEACRPDAPRVTPEQAALLRKEVPEWRVIDRDGVGRLERTFKFKDFVSALDFTNEVGRIAEQEGHHPEILTSWGKVTVTWWTHKIGGLHRNDFIMAAKTDRIYQSRINP
jgi:4a-hydroxytetrahydrobiopterin dehydratase